MNRANLEPTLDQSCGDGFNTFTDVKPSHGVLEEIRSSLLQTHIQKKETQRDVQSYLKLYSISEIGLVPDPVFL